MAYMGLQPFRYRRDGSMVRLSKIVDHRQRTVPSVARGTSMVAFNRQHIADDTLWVGPVVAEFGHELWVAAMARRAAQAFRSCTVCSRAGREALYADFATKFIPHDLACDVSGVHPISVTPEVSAEIARLVALAGKHSRLQVTEFSTAAKSAAMTTVVYGHHDAAYAGYILLHARHRDHVRARNWPMKNWEALVARLRHDYPSAKVGSIGSLGAALHVPGTDDLRALPLHRQMDVLRSAKLAVGPSSGPMHLASLCKCPHVVWCGGNAGEQNETRTRYESLWNPHQTPAIALPCQDKTWRIEPDVVYGGVTKMLERMANVA